MPKPRQNELEAYLDEALPPDEMARIEHSLRQHPECVEHLAAINSRRNAGVHTLGEIWRRHRLSCPTRGQLGSYLLGGLPDELAEHIRFHVEVVGCRRCLASLSDLRRMEAETPEVVQTRRRKYFESSAGYL